MVLRVVGSSPISHPANPDVLRDFVLNESYGLAVVFYSRGFGIQLVASHKNFFYHIVSSTPTAIDPRRPGTRYFAKKTICDCREGRKDGR